MTDENNETLNEKVLCIFHSSDFDGHCSAAIVRKKYPDCELLAMNYNYDIKWEYILSFDIVIMVDFSFKMDDMRKLRDNTKLIWIDHHISAITDYHKSDLDINCYLNTRYAACELTWMHFFNSKTSIAVKLLGRYDIWDHSDPDTLPFQYGLRQYKTDIRTEEGQDIWKTLLSNTTRLGLGDIIEKGKTILDYQTEQNSVLCKSYSFPSLIKCESKVYKAICINTPMANSIVFDSVWDENLYDVMLRYSWSSSGEYIVSLYTTKDDVDCSEICKFYGGGGHKKAAGFQCEYLPFPINTHSVNAVRYLHNMKTHSSTEDVNGRFAVNRGLRELVDGGFVRTEDGKYYFKSK